MDTSGGPGGGFRRSGEVLKETVMAVVEAQWFLAALHLRNCFPFSFVLGIVKVFFIQERETRNSAFL